MISFTIKFKSCFNTKKATMGKAKNKIIASMITIAVLGLLVFAGPAQAYTLSLDFENTTAEQGKKIQLTATVDPEGANPTEIDEITLILTPEQGDTIECSFDVTGKMKSGTNTECHGINIKKTPQPKINQNYGYNYGYSYGYGYGSSELVYEITIHTQKFSVGKYNTQLKVTVDNSEYTEDGEKITITPKLKGKEHQEQNQQQETEQNQEEDDKKEKNTNTQHESNGNVNGKGWLAEDDDDEEEEENEETEQEAEEETTQEQKHEEKTNNSGNTNNNAGGKTANSGSTSPNPPENNNAGGNGKSNGKNK